MIILQLMFEIVIISCLALSRIMKYFQIQFLKKYSLNLFEVFNFAYQKNKLSIFF